LTKLTKDELLFREYIKDKRFLIVDSNKTDRSAISRVLSELGSSQSNVKITGNFKDAENLLLEFNPNIIITEYLLDNQCGLELVFKQRELINSTRDYLFVVVTRDATENSIAEAAEEDVDAFILKPLTVNKIRKYLIDSVKLKVIPDEYKTKIESAKKFKSEGDYENAIEELKAALTLSSKPTLAHYYLGLIYLETRSYEDAHEHFKAGLKINPSHYRCMNGLCEYYSQTDQSKIAYDFAKQISLIYPVSPLRLESFIHLAIETKQFTDIEGFYESYTKLKFKSQTLQRTMSSALIVVGKAHLRNDLRDQASEHFKKAVSASDKDGEVLFSIVHELTRFKLTDEANFFLKMFPYGKRSTIEYVCSEFVIFESQNSSADVLERGRKLILKDMVDPLIYRILIGHAKKEGHARFAENLVEEASKKFPSRKKEFNDFLASKTK